MTSQGSPQARFERALATGNPTIAQAAAFELVPVHLEHALALVLLVRDVQPERYEEFALRFHVMLIRECRLEFTEAQLALAALQALGGRAPGAGAAALHAVLEGRDTRAARRIENWLAR